MNDSKTRDVLIGSKKFNGETFNHRLKLDWTQNDFTNLGIKFSCNIDTIVEINFREKINEIEKQMKQWSKRVLTPFGRITVLKTTIISKLNHLFIALPNPDTTIIDKLNKAFYNFIWQSKADKVKRSILVQEYNKGGLKMIELNKFIIALKTSLIRRLVVNDSKYKSLFENTYTNVNSVINRGSTFAEETKRNCQNKFWVDVLSAWNTYCSVITLQIADDIIGINLWDNKNLKINDKPVFYKIWYDKGVNFIKDLINKNGELLSYEQFIDKYQIQTNFLEFYGIISIVGNFIRNSGIDLNNAPLTNCYFPFNIKGIIKNKKRLHRNI